MRSKCLSSRAPTFGTRWAHTDTITHLQSPVFLMRWYVIRILGHGNRVCEKEMTNAYAGGAPCANPVIRNPTSASTLTNGMTKKRVYQFYLFCSIHFTTWKNHIWRVNTSYEMFYWRRRHRDSWTYGSAFIKCTWSRLNTSRMHRTCTKT